jgi:RNA polymerase sigma-70 factor (family 1)
LPFAKLTLLVTAMPSNTIYEPHIYEHADVLNLLAQGSEYAFQLVFDSYKNRVYKLALTYLKSPVLAEEVVQDTFLKLWFQRQNLAGINSLEAWLLTVSKNLTINYLKKIAHEWGAKKDLAPAHEQIENRTDFKVRDAEFTILFQKALDTLSTQQRTIYKMAREEGLTYELIAKKLSISPLTVKTHMARALASMRLFLKKHGGLFFSFLLLLFCL